MKSTTKHFDDQIRDWFLEYSSYVILERAVPHLSDGLKPVQRRILHSMYEMEDGRYNKVQTIVGHTAKYHPHGDMAVKDALVTIGQKDWLIDKQGSWGNLLTGDGAAAGRYIEARLTKLAKENVYNPRLTGYKPNYDGRYQEPESLPVKLPILLMQGTEGIAVGLACSILPHNFNEVMDACMAELRGQKFELVPDFHSGGKVDLTEYNGGKRGKVKVRAVIDKVGDTRLLIKELPFGVTTIDLKESIVQAALKNKIRIKEVTDHTTNAVCLYVELPAGEDQDRAIAALYAFTKCEVTLSANAVVIHNNRPEFLSTAEILRHNVQSIKELIRRELCLQISDLTAQERKLGLEKLFIMEKLYRGLETTKDFQEYARATTAAFLKHGISVLPEELDSLVAMPIRKIARYDISKVEEMERSILEKKAVAQRNLDQLTKTAIRHFRELKDKYGSDVKRRTAVEKFTYSAAEKIESTYRIYANLETGFVGSNLRKESPVDFEVSSLTDVIGVSGSGTARMNRVGDKTYFGEKLIHLAPYDRNNTCVYNLVYQCQKTGRTFAKRFQINKGLIRNKEYILCGDTGNKVWHFSKQSGKKAPLLEIKSRTAKKTSTIRFDMNDLAVKNMQAQGNLVTKNSIISVAVKP